jgi:hypothetical protein
MAPAFLREALTLCPQLYMGSSLRRYTQIGLLKARLVAALETKL